MSETPLPSLSTSGAADWKATKRASALIDGVRLEPAPSSFVLSTLTRLVVTPVRSRTNTSVPPLRSWATRLSAGESKATTRPSALIDGDPLPDFASAPEPWTLTRVIVLFVRSRRKTSEPPLVSLGTRFTDVDLNATYRPSRLIAGLV